MIAAWPALFCLALLLGCAGGSGSSGFDVVENAAIDQALDEQRCIESGGLVICPADTAVPAATDTPTVSPTPTFVPATSTPTAAATAPEQGTPTLPTAAAATATVTATPQQVRTPTFTPTPTSTPPAPSTPGMRIDVGLALGDVMRCTTVDDSCEFSFRFTVQGFPPNTAFLAASRRLSPESIWEITVPVLVASAGDSMTFDASIRVPAGPPGEAIPVQVAVLAQSTPADSAPSSVDFLGESSAEFAFVTPVLQVVPGS
jgi:hypothetical protein